MSDLADATATELLELYAQGTASPVDAVTACLDRIEAVEPALNAIVTLLGEEALAQARTSEERWQRGEARELEGVPYGLKDIVATAGILTTGGSSLYRDSVPEEDAALAARLRVAGGVLLAKLHTFEFACGGADNRTFGICRNPWDVNRTTGGSSSGSGAAVASGEMPIAVGTDTGGSIRIPAAYCGITGIKPTYGRVPRHGVMGLSWTMDHAGPMTRSVRDAALALQVMAGHDPRDATCSARPVPDLVAACDQDVAGMVVGRPRGWFEDRMHPQVASVYEAALSQLSELGVTIVDVELDGLGLADVASWNIIYAEMVSLHEGFLDLLEDRDAMGARLLADGSFVSASDYLRSVRYRTVFQAALQQAFEGLDALAVPGATSIAPPLDTMCCDIGDEQVDWLAVATRTHVPFNLSGSPGLCLPIGLVEGLPASLQLVGRPHDEGTILALGAAYQQTTGHHRRRPPVVSAVSD
jgi:aspartyl-tRNA(Asn)/glutamyl-tRNA(Gln) amidotransferase subunit A